MKFLENGSRPQPPTSPLSCLLHISMYLCVSFISLTHIHIFMCLIRLSRTYPCIYDPCIYMCLSHVSMYLCLSFMSLAHIHVSRIVFWCIPFYTSLAHFHVSRTWFMSLAHISVFTSRSYISKHDGTISYTHTPLWFLEKIKPWCATKKTWQCIHNRWDYSHIWTSHVMSHTH